MIATPKYTEQLNRTIAQLFFRYQDFMLNMATPNPKANPRREEILMAQYPMEKKGKTLGTLEERVFSIRKGQLRQIDKSGMERDLPWPKEVWKEKLGTVNGGQWAFQGYGYRIGMQFEQRTPIYIYLKTPEEQTQIHSFLHSKCHPTLQKHYKTALLTHTISKLTKTKLSKNYGGLDKRRLLTLTRIKNQMKDPQLIKQMLMEWQRKAVMSPGLFAKEGNVLNVKTVVSELGFRLEQMNTCTGVGIAMGELKLWVGQVTYGTIFRFNEEHILREEEREGEEVLMVATTINLKGGEVKLRNETPPLSIWTVLQFQVETRDKEGQGRSWKSEKFYVMDLLKSFSTGPRKTITLHSSKQFLQLLLTATSAKSLALKPSLPPQHEQFPSSYTYKLTPNLYPILHELLPAPLLKKYIKSITPQTIHLQYTIAYQQFLQNQAVQSLSFGGLGRLCEILQVQGIVEKFYGSQPFCQYAGQGDGQGRGTLVYEMLGRRAERFSYYDAEKFIWKYQCTGLRRFLSIIKAFDEFPRINYTQPFFLLCLQCLNLCQKQSLLKWKTTFTPSLPGRQSLAFFLILGILKFSTHLLLYQPTKPILANNSLLFHYTLKKHNNKLYNKFLQIQLNVEALFGIESLGMFAGLFVGLGQGGFGGAGGVFLGVVERFVVERKEQMQSSDGGLRNSHYISLIATFLAIIHLFDNTLTHKLSTSTQQSKPDPILGSSCAYSTANSYLSYLRIFTSTQLQLYTPQLISLYSRYYALCVGELSCPQYVGLQGSLEKFHGQNCVLGGQGEGEGEGGSIGGMKLGELMEQLYTEFSCFRQKNQADIRKISLILDHINLGQYLLPNNTNQSQTTSTAYRPASLTIQLLQSSHKLYQHQYILPHKQSPTEPHTLHYPNIKHNLELKLNRLTPLTLLLQYTHNNNSLAYTTQLNLQQIPSNYYIQLVRELKPVVVGPGGSVRERDGDLCTGGYVCLQVYVRDSCDVDYIENAVPNMYINGLLLRGRVVDGGEDYRKDVIFCNHYFRSFRLMENNFNLLYAKLGWYGNHYLIPSDRITSLYISQQPPPPPQSQNNPQTLLQLSQSNTPEFSLTQLPQAHRQRINQILFYTRCIYGRGLVPSIAYTGGGAGTQIFMESLRGGIGIREGRDMRGQVNQVAYNSCGNLLGYLFENFGGWLDGGDEDAGFVDFYIRATEELPLLRYLAFRPLEFYLLEDIKIILHVPTLVDPGMKNTQSQEVDVRSYSSNPVQQSSSFPKAKTFESPLFHKQSSQSSKPIRSYQIILTNHPITQPQNTPQQYPHKFLTNPSQFPLQLHLTYPSTSPQQNNTSSTSPYTSHKQFYIYLQESASYLPPVMYFTYPDCIDYRGVGEEQVGGGGGTGGMFGVACMTEMGVDQFLYLLLGNVVRYYGREGKEEGRMEKGKDKEKEKLKEKEKQKEREKKYSKVLGCQLKISSPPIPNTSISTLFQFLCQTKHQLTLSLHPITPPTLPSSSSSSSISSPPLILNPLHRHYTSFALHNNNWQPICILAKLVSPNYEIYYAEEKGTRRYRLFRAADVVLGLEAKRMMDCLPVFKFTDFQVLAGRDCVRKELCRIL